MDLVILLAVAWALSRAWDHAKQTRGASRDQRVQAAEKAAGVQRSQGGSLTPARQRSVKAQHDIGWWSSELLHGAPVHRTGFHAGWLANKAAAVQARHRREEARTTHAEVRASFGQAIREHRDRRAMALAEIDSNLADRAGGKEAVRQAASNVVALPVTRAAPAPDPVVVTPATARMPAMGPFAPPPVTRNGTSTDVKPDPQPAEGNNHMPPTLAAAADVTYDGLQRELGTMAAKIEGAINDIRLQQVMNQIDSLGSVLRDAQTLGDLEDTSHELREAKNALQRALDQVLNAKDRLRRNHGGMNEAHQSAPVAGAEPEFYEG